MKDSRNLTILHSSTCSKVPFTPYGQPIQMVSKISHDKSGGVYNQNKTIAWKSNQAKIASQQVTSTHSNIFYTI